MMKYFNLKIIGLVLVLKMSLVFSQFSFARRVRDIGDIAGFLRQTLVGIGYEQKAKEISALIDKLFPNLEELNTLSPEEKIIALAQLIKSNIETYNWKEGREFLYFELPEILENKKAVCFGYAELFYVLAKALGLNVELIPVYPQHAVNLIKLDTGYMILDLGLNYKSHIFDWDENYKQEGSIWYLRKGSRLPEIYKIIQRVNEQGIIEYRYFHRGWVLEQSGRYNEAIEYYKKAPRVAEASRNHGLILYNQGQFNEAIEHFDMAIAINPYFAEAFQSRGAAKGNLGQFNEALEDLKIATGLNPSSAGAWVTRGGLEASLKQYPEAIKSLEIAIALKPDADVLAEAFYNLGRVYIDLGKFNEAITYFSDSIEHNPYYAEAWFHRGYCEFQLGQTQKGIEDIKKAIELDPSLYNRLPPEVQKLLG